MEELGLPTAILRYNKDWPRITRWSGRPTRDYASKADLLAHLELADKVLDEVLQGACEVKLCTIGWLTGVGVAWRVTSRRGHVQCV